MKPTNGGDSNSHKDISRITSLHQECLREQRKYNHAKNCSHSHTAAGLLTSDPPPEWPEVVRPAYTEASKNSRAQLLT